MQLCALFRNVKFRITIITVINRDGIIFKEQKVHSTNITYIELNLSKILKSINRSVPVSMSILKEEKKNCMRKLRLAPVLLFN